jgi:hypothetical protein
VSDDSRESARLSLGTLAMSSRWQTSAGQSRILPSSSMKVMFALVTGSVSPSRLHQILSSDRRASSGEHSVARAIVHTSTAFSFSPRAASRSPSRSDGRAWSTGLACPVTSLYLQSQSRDSRPNHHGLWECLPVPADHSGGASASEVARETVLTALPTRRSARSRTLRRTPGWSRLSGLPRCRW